MPRIGVDLGGTKIEAIVFDDAGGTARRRVATPAGDYAATVDTVGLLVEGLVRDVGSIPPDTPVGVGTPGSISPVSGLIRNANSVVLNGRPLARDLAMRLGRRVRLANDANCFALSEATDGAGAGHRVVFGVILGTGVGGGIVVDGGLVEGRHAIAGEWGHDGLPRVEPVDLPLPACWCGRAGCVETYLSGPAMAADHARHAPSADAPADTVADARSIAAAAAAGDDAARATLARYARRLAKSLATVVNLLDPDVIVLGGGVSNVDALYALVPPLLPEFVFSDTVSTPIVRNRHGDASGVRGAAWLWPAG